MFMKASALQKGVPGTTPWIKRIGLAGFSFFFIKGMLWLLIPWLGLMIAH